MYLAGERAIEQAEAMVTAERDKAIADIRAQLAEPGADDCEACGDKIPEKRRAAMPSARRCADCEGLRERAAKRGW
jgi:phage/conjugal plasmid C-4 type zinc finger TraR family protein